MLCERGIRTFETAYRFTLDLTAVPVLKELAAPADRRPEPRRGPARPRRAAVARRGRGRRRRRHRRGPEPEEAICDGPQALRPEGFAEYAARVQAAAAVAGKAAVVGA